MHVIDRKMLRDFWEKFPDSEGPLKAWFKEAVDANWKNPAEVKAKYGTASFVGNCTVFNIHGNDYRLVVWINYVTQRVFTRWVGTHEKYDELDIGAM